MSLRQGALGGRCPYCNSRMYRVLENEHPELETRLCYACGGCVIFELEAPRPRGDLASPRPKRDGTGQAARPTYHPGGSSASLVVRRGLGGDVPTTSWRSKKDGREPSLPEEFVEEERVDPGRGCKDGVPEVQKPEQAAKHH